MAWAAKRPANERFTGLFLGPLTAQFRFLLLIGPLTSRYQFLKLLLTFIFLSNAAEVYKRMGFGRAELYFWD